MLQRTLIIYQMVIYQIGLYSPDLIYTCLLLVKLYEEV